MNIQYLLPKTWVAETKFLLPILKTDLVVRPQLNSKVYHSIIQNRLTIISAPAGSGKTTLLSSLPARFPNLSLGWFSLGEEDNDPLHFIAGLIGALGTFHSELRNSSQRWLVQPDISDEQTHLMIDQLINDILQFLPGEFVLVFDDLHRVTAPGVYLLIDYLIERMPTQMHLVIATRHAPGLTLSRLWARGQLKEFHLDDLRFSIDEAATFFNKHLELKLSSVDLKTLYNCTEGWAAGLRILTTSLDRFTAEDARSLFIKNLAQHDRYIFNYLAEEIFQQQSPMTQTFLLETSILAELTPHICESVTGRDDVIGTLKQLYQDNLFLAVVDEQCHIYRYHDLFRSFLKQRLAEEMPPEVVAMLHKCAAHAQSLPGPAIQHYLAAGMWEAAAQAIEQAGKQMLQLGLLNTIHEWVQLLPKETLTSYPRLSYYQGLFAFLRGDMVLAKLKFEQALRGFELAEDQAGCNETLVQLANCYLGLNEYELAHKLTEHGLMLPTLDSGSRVVLLNLRIWLEMLQQRWDFARADFETALKVTLESQNLGTFTIMAHHMRASVIFLPEKLEHLENYCEQVLIRYKEQTDSLLLAGTHSIISCLQLIRGNWEEATREVEKTRLLSQKLGGIAMLEVESLVVLAHYYMGCADYSALNELLETYVPQIEQSRNSRHWVMFLKYFQGRAAWVQGKTKEARKIYGQMLTGKQPAELPGTEVVREIMAALLEISAQHYAEAEKLLLPLVELEQQIRFSTLFASARMLLAHIYLCWHKPEKALTLIEPMLAECQASGTAGFILKEGSLVIPLLRLAVSQNVHSEYAMHLLKIIEVQKVESSQPEISTQPFPIPGTGETLSPRELQVIKLLANRASNKEIASNLIVSEQTVKSHVKNILSKLDLTSRNEVGNRALELLLL